MANWLNTFFSGIDGGVFRALNSINCEFLNTFAKVITFLGEKGIIYLLIGFICLFFAKTRKIGICIIGGVAFSFLFTSCILKNIIERPRPYNTSAEFNEFWIQAGSRGEGGFSFPSGHATVVTSFSVILFTLCNKKWSFVGFIFAFFIYFSRIYLIAHYFTDVVAGIVVGVISAFCSYLVTLLIYKILEKNKDKKFFNFILNEDVIKRKEK